MFLSLVSLCSSVFSVPLCWVESLAQRLQRPGRDLSIRTSLEVTVDSLGIVGDTGNISIRRHAAVAVAFQKPAHELGTAVGARSFNQRGADAALVARPVTARTVELSNRAPSRVSACIDARV